MDPEAPPPRTPDPLPVRFRRNRRAPAVPGVVADGGGAVESEMAAARFPCPVCGTRIEATRERCFGCGWAGPPPDEAARQATLARGARIVYLLMGLSLFAAIPAVGALALAYADRGKARGTWLDSHYEWQVETLWGVFWMGVAVLIATWLGDRFLHAGEWLLLTGLPALAWYARRIVKGWTRLADGEPVTEY